LYRWTEGTLNRQIGSHVTARQIVFLAMALVATPAALQAQTASCSAVPTPPVPPWRLHNNPPPTPLLLTPARAASVATSRPVFSWTPVMDSEGDSVIFQIQIDDDADFSSPEVDAKWQTHPTLVPEEPLADGTYCWRVRSIDDIQAASPYSAAFVVTIRSDAGTTAGPDR
jgi:hypothetical protein